MSADKRLSPEMVRAWLTHAQTGGGIDLDSDHAAILLADHIAFRDALLALCRAAEMADEFSAPDTSDGFRRIRLEDFDALREATAAARLLVEDGPTEGT